MMTVITDYLQVISAMYPKIFSTHGYLATTSILSCNASYFPMMDILSSLAYAVGKIL